jgi:hypothetical protein
MNLEKFGGLCGDEQAALNAIHRQDIVDKYLQLDLKNVPAKFDAGGFGVHFAWVVRGEPVERLTAEVIPRFLAGGVHFFQESPLRVWSLPVIAHDLFFPVGNRDW